MCSLISGPVHAHNFFAADFLEKLYKPSSIYKKILTHLLKKSVTAPTRDFATPGHRASQKDLGFALVHCQLVVFMTASWKTETKFSFLLLFCAKNKAHMSLNLHFG